MLEQLIAYFHRSRLEYLALDYGECSIRLARGRDMWRSADAERLVHVDASSVGVISFANGREKFPEAGATVAEGEPLFGIRRFRSTIEVSAGAAGILESVRVQPGDFVEYAQSLATIRTGKT